MDVKMLVATLPDDANLAAWCRKLNVSRQTAYKWRARYRAEGPAGLVDRSRAAINPHGRTEAAMEELIVATRKTLADEGFDAGAASIQDRLVRRGLEPPSEATIYRILVRRGQVTAQPAKRPKATYRRFQRARPNECWQGDDTHYLLATGQEVRVINIVDDHSRYNGDSLAVTTCTSAAVWQCFTRAACRLGPPAEFLDDNGTAYTSRPGDAPVVFQAHLARLGVLQLRSRPRHPQTCGKVERFHQTQRRWLAAHDQAATVAELQALLDCFRDLYNLERPHRAIGRRTPAEVWSAQPPAAPARAATDPVTRVNAARTDPGGVLHIGSQLSIGLGAEWRHRHLTLIRRGLQATVITTTTAEIVRELTIDPTRRYQPTGQSRGRRPNTKQM